MNASRAEIAAIVARESAETLVGAASGRRVAATRRLLVPAAHLLARRFVEYDGVMGDRGPFRGAEWIVARATGGLTVTGAERIPATGPVLVVANHPGLTDAVSLLATVRRNDAWIVTANYPFLRAQRRASERFVFIDDRCTALRHIVRRLRRGVVVAQHRAHRSSRMAFENPPAKRRAPQREQQRFASLLQLAMPAYQHQPVTVRFGTPIVPSIPALHDAVIASMARLMGHRL